MEWYTVTLETTFGEVVMRRFSRSPVEAVRTASTVLQRRNATKRGFDILKTYAISDALNPNKVIPGASVPS